MKYILSLIIGGALVVSGFGQTRNVLVGTNNAVVQPTNFWSADASNARVGLGLGSAATNPASAFQISSVVLSNLASSNAINLTNLRATNIIGIIPSSNIPILSLTNISGTLEITSGGTGATNAATARTNLGLGWSALTNTNSATTLLGHTANGEVIYLGENPLTFTNDFIDVRGISVDGFLTWDVVNNSFYTDLSLQNSSISFFGTNASFAAATTRTNLGIPWSGLTNTNAVTFQAALFGTNTNPVLVNTSGSVVSPTNFWAVAPISTTVQYQTNVTGTSTNAATNSRNLFLFSLSPSVSGVTNTVTLPTNPATTFEGDRATITHLAQTTNSVTAIRQLGAVTNLITLNQLDETVLLIYRSGAWRLADNISYIEPIYFSGTNAAANAASSRTNLGLGTTNDVSFSILRGGSQTNHQMHLDNAEFYGDWTFMDNVEIEGAITFDTPATTRTNLGLGATWLINTNAANFRTAIGLGATNVPNFGGIKVGADIDITPAGMTGYGSEIDLEERDLTAGSGYDWNLGGSGMNDVEVISFDSTTSAATTRTNLGLPLVALTNTNNANFQAAVFATNAAPTNTANVNTVNFNTAVHWLQITVPIAGTNQTFRIPLFQ